MRRRVLSAFLCAIMVLSFVPFSSAAEETFNEIYTVEDLYNVRYDLSANYIMMNDIDLTEATAAGGDYDFMGNGWNPIGSNDIYGEEAFTGVFDGNGHSVIGMQMRLATSSLPSGSIGKNLSFALFSHNGGTIRNLKVAGSISGKYMSKQYFDLSIGSIAGINSGVVDNCASAVDVDIVGEYLNFYVGGVAGQFKGGSVSRCYNTGNITVDCWTSAPILGGICVMQYNCDGEIRDCFNAGTICSSARNGGTLDDRAGRTKYAYGVVGSRYSWGSGLHFGVTNCYNIGMVLQKYGDGKGKIVENKCFAIGSGGVTYLTSAYYLADSGNNSPGATSLTDAQMRQQSSFAGFDFDNMWVIYPDSSYKYPQLRSNPIDTENTVLSIRIISLPTKTSYLEGKENLNLSGGKVTVDYKDGTSEIKTLTRDMVSGFDNSRPGTQTLTVTFGRNTTTFDVEIVPKTLAGIEVSQLPNQTGYIEGLENLNLTGGKLKLLYDNGTWEETLLSNAVVSGFDNALVGSQTLTAVFKGFRTQFNVQILAKSVDSIDVSSLPTKTEYVEQKDRFDPAGGKLLVRYNNGTTGIIDLNESMVSGFDNSTPGVITLKVTYMDRIATFRVTILQRSAASISIQSLPDKLNYIEGLESLSLTGGKISIQYNNGTIGVVDMSAATVTGFDNSIVGTNRLTVSYQGKTATFDVNILAKSIAGIEMAKNPSKLIYLEGKENFDTTGGKVKINYNNGTFDEIDLDDSMVSGFDNMTSGSQRLTVTYLGKTTFIDIEITAKQPVSVEMETLPAKLVYLEGKDSLSVTGGRLKINYDNGTYALVAITSDMVSGFDNSRPGIWSLVVTYQRMTTRYQIEVVAKTISSVAVSTKPQKLTFIEAKESLETLGGKLTVYYDNGTSDVIDINPSMVTGFDTSKAGSLNLTVTYAGKTDTYGVTIAHDYVVHSIPATCLEGGINEYVCAHCGDLYREPGQAALGHNFVNYVSDHNATCTQDGTKTAKCSRCDAVKTIADSGSATGHHAGAWEVLQKASCTENGKKVRRCTICGEIVSDDIIPAEGHIFGEWVITITPTETTSGEKEHVCTVCGHKETEPLSAYGLLPRITFESDSVKSGETVEVYLVMNSSPVLTSVSISEIEYDKTVFELVSGEWLIPDMLMNTFVSSTGVGAAGFEQKTVSGNVFKMCFKALPEAVEGEYDVSCLLSGRNDRYDVDIAVVPGVIVVKNRLRGDLNGDGYVSDADAIYLLMYTFFPELYPVESESECDFNRDESVTDADAIYLLMYTFFPEMYPIDF